MMAKTRNSLPDMLRRLVLLIGLVVFASAVRAQSELQLNMDYRAATDFERMGYYDRAAEKFRQLFDRDPVNGIYYSGAKRNLERLGRYPELVEVIQRRLQVVDDVMTRAELGSAYYKNGQRQEATLMWDGLLRDHPADANMYAQVAAVMQSNNLLAEAVAVYKKGRDALHNQKLFMVELANLYAEQTRIDLATEAFLDFIEQNPKQLPYVQARVLSFFDRDNGPTALLAYEKYLHQQKQPSTEILQLYANCLKRAGKFEEAFQAQIRIEDQKPEAEKKRDAGIEVFNFANEAQQVGQSSIAIKAYEYLVASWPNSPYVTGARMGLAKALEALGKYDDAISVLDALIDSGSRSPQLMAAYIAKGNLLLEKLEKPRQAIEVFLVLYRNFPTRDAQKQAVLALGDSYFQLGEIGNAEKWYNEAFHLAANQDVAFKNQVNYRMANLLFCHREFTKALACLDKVEPDPHPLRADNDLLNDALEFALFIENSKSDSAGALAMYAGYKQMAARRQVAAAADTLETLVSRFPISTVAPRAMLDLAEAYRQLDRQEQAIGAFQRFMRSYPGSIYADEAMFHLAEAYALYQKPVEAIKTYEKLLAEFPQSIYLEESRHRLRTLRDNPPKFLPD